MLRKHPNNLSAALQQYTTQRLPDVHGLLKLNRVSALCRPATRAPGAAAVLESVLLGQLRDAAVSRLTAPAGPRR